MAITRWVASRKLAVVNAVLSGKMTAYEACATYALSPEELKAWLEAYKNGKSLKVYGKRSL